MKLFLTFLIALILVECNDTKTTDSEKNADTESVPLSKLDMVDELAGLENNDVIFKASGTEPGWMADFYKERIRLILNFGRDSIIINRNNADINGKGEVKIKLPSGAHDFMTIENKPCTAISGDVSERTVTIKCKETNYKGCGGFIK